MDTTSVVIDGLLLRQLELSYASATLAMSPGCWPTCRVTERLGNWKYLFDFQNGSCDAETFLGLRCYEDPDITWQNPQVTQCELGVGLEEHVGIRMEVMPTLVIQGEQVQITGAAGAVDVLDATGRLVRTLTTSGRISFAFDRSGAYVLRLTSDRGERAVQRVMVR